MPDSTPFTFAFVILPKFSGLTVSSLVEPLRIANYCAGEELYQWRYLSVEGGNVLSCSGMGIDTETLAADDQAWDSIIVCGGWNVLLEAWPLMSSPRSNVSPTWEECAELLSNCRRLVRIGFIPLYKPVSFDRPRTVSGTSARDQNAHGRHRRARGHARPSGPRPGPHGRLPHRRRCASRGRAHKRDNMHILALARTAAPIRSSGISLRSAFW